MININNGRYKTFSEKMSDFIRAGKYVIVTFFTNAEGTSIATDTEGNQIQFRKISSISYDYPSEETTNGSLSITFMDSGTFTVVDDVDSIWFSMDVSTDIERLA
jgi:hypothetical protein